MDGTSLRLRSPRKRGPSPLPLHSRPKPLRPSATSTPTLLRCKRPPSLLRTRSSTKRSASKAALTVRALVTLPMQGHFYLHSYRDPHIASTLRVFQEAISAIASKQFQASDVDEAKLGMIQQFDTPISPGARRSPHIAGSAKEKAKRCGSSIAIKL